jgi:hypothetical protein
MLGCRSVLSRRRPAIGLAALSAVLLATFSCRQLIGITDNPPGEEGSTSACELPYGTETCASCASASCCAESTACAADPGCATFEKCFGPCNGDAKCWAQCLLQFPSSNANVTALSACMATSCDSQCGLTCGAFVGSIVEPDVAAACQSCIVSQACAASLACARSASCDAISRCYKQACNTVDCQDSCAVVNGLDPAYQWEPDGGTGGLYGAFSTAVTACAPACSEDWSCLGHVSWPAPVSAMDTYHFWLRDYVTGLPVQGASVTLCSTPDVNCAMPKASSTTNASGEVSLPFQNTSISGIEQSGLVGFLRSTADGYMPADYYWTHPLGQAQMDSYTELATLAEWQQVAAEVSVTQASDRGIVTVAAYGCPGIVGSQADIKVAISTADAMTQSFTLSGVAADVTDKVGFLVFFNVPAGTFQWTTTATAVGKQAGTATASVRAGAETVILAFVTP